MQLFSTKNTNSLSTIIKTFEKHLSIVNIKKQKLDLVLKVIRDLNTKSSYQTSDTPIKIIKLNFDIFSNFIYKHFNYCIDKGEFPNDMKYVDIIPIHEKKNIRKRKLLTCKHFMKPL